MTHPKGHFMTFEQTHRLRVLDGEQPRSVSIRVVIKVHHSLRSVAQQMIEDELECLKFKFGHDNCLSIEALNLREWEDTEDLAGLEVNHFDPSKDV